MPREITLPEAKPALEWVNGRVLQKVSPKRQHGIAQGRFYAALDAWAQDRRLGIVATEWRFRVQPPGEVRRPLVPDVAYLSYARLPYEEQQVTDEPKVAPDAVVEVLSPSDRRADVEDEDTRLSRRRHERHSSRRSEAAAHTRSRCTRRTNGSRRRRAYTWLAFRLQLRSTSALLRAAAGRVVGLASPICATYVSFSERRVCTRR